MAPDKTGWTFLTNHAHVLLCLAHDSSMRMRDIAQAVGVTERAVQHIIAELEEGGYVEHDKEGRRNTYRVHAARRLRHPLEHHRQIADLIQLIYPSTPTASENNQATKPV